MRGQFRRSCSVGKSCVPAIEGIGGVDGIEGYVAVGVLEEASIEVDAAGSGGEAVGKLDAALGVAELTVDVGEVGEALAEAIDGEIGAGTGDGGTEGGCGDVLENLLHGVDEVYVKALGVGGILCAADGAEDGRRGGVVGGVGG